MQVPEALKDTKTLAIVAGVGTAAVAGAYLVKRSRRDPKPKMGPLTPDTLPKDAYDAVVVGAGAAAPFEVIMTNQLATPRACRQACKLTFAISDCCSRKGRLLL